MSNDFEMPPPIQLTEDLIRYQQELLELIEHCSGANHIAFIGTEASRTVTGYRQMLQAYEEKWLKGGLQ